MPGSSPSASVLCSFSGPSNVPPLVHRWALRLLYHPAAGNSPAGVSFRPFWVLWGACLVPPLLGFTCSPLGSTHLLGVPLSLGFPIWGMGCHPACGREQGDCEKHSQCPRAPGCSVRATGPPVPADGPWCPRAGGWSAEHGAAVSCSSPGGGDRSSTFCQRPERVQGRGSGLKRRPWDEPSSRRLCRPLPGPQSGAVGSVPNTLADVYPCSETSALTPR